MSYTDALTTAREALMADRKKIDEMIAGLDRLLGVPARQLPDPKAANRTGGVQPTATQPDRVGKIRAMYEAGEMPDAIGKKVGVSGQTVRNLAKRFEWKKPVAIKKLPRGVSGRAED